MNSQNVKMKPFYPYQTEADNAMTKCLQDYDKCIVKMFCGTGKSLLMRYCQIAQKKPLVVFVFPTLGLIKQFSDDYLNDVQPCQVLKISSEKDNESTTEPTKIISFLQRPYDKIICITYQSFETLLDNLGSIKIDVCFFDEAHHAVGQYYQKLIFERPDCCLKQVFLTATPKNENGIIMYDQDNIMKGSCGRLVYDYSYLKALNDGYLNAFDIRVEMYMENSVKSVYETIARSILTTGNNRVLTFHADVNLDRDNSVKRFVNETLFQSTFQKVLHKEFPELKRKYKKINMIDLHSGIPVDKRTKILEQFDKTPLNQVMVISSCETIGEGIDTKNANMCVFVDPKTSYVKIIQNIGRVVRKQLMKSTILIPCWVDKSKYVGCEDDPEKRDQIIRESMNENGDFSGILNVLCALKQEDEELYDICLKYPNQYSPQEIENHLDKNGFMIDEPVGDGSLLEALEHMLETDVDVDFDDDLEEEEWLLDVAEDNEVCIEIHTNSLEQPVEYYNQQPNCPVVRLYRNEDEGDMVVYHPILESETMRKRTDRTIREPSRENRPNFQIHTNEDVKVFWKITSDVDFTQNVCNCVIDCEVVRKDPMETAIEIVERAKEREKNGQRLLPRFIDKTKQITPELEQENKDAKKLGNWKQALKGKSKGKCSNEVREYLDTHLPGWRDEIDLDEQAMKQAKDIVKRAKEREKNGQRLLPRNIHKPKRNTPELEQEYRDAVKLGTWKQSLKGKGSSKCSNEVRDYLDTHLPGWRDELDEIAMKQAKDIVERAKDREKNGQRLLPRAVREKEKRTTVELEQENKDAEKLSKWKQALKGKNKAKCSIEVLDYLDTHLPGWRDEIDLDEQAMKQAKEIVERAKEREKNGQRILPRLIVEKEKRITPELEKEHRDQEKLGMWKKALKGKGSSKCSNEVRDYLDTHLPGWRYEVDFDEQAMKQAKEIVERAKEREKNGQRVLPRLIGKKEKRITPELEEEHKDAGKLGNWKKALKGKNKAKCSNEVRDYLDTHLPGWRDEVDFDEQAMKQAKEIVERAKEREKNGQRILPRKIIKTNQTTLELEQEYKDATKLNDWKKALKGKGSSKCSNEVRDYLDTHLPGWRETNDDETLTTPNETVDDDEEEYILTKSTSSKTTPKPKPKKSMSLKTPSRQSIEKQKKEKRQQTKSVLSGLHQKYKTMTSTNLQTLFRSSPDLWHTYHTISEENEQSFPEDEIPRNRIIQEFHLIKTKRKKMVVDMGCGKAQIANYFKDDPRFQFINYDHISYNEHIQECDISNLPLETDSVEICILSLAMWGSNCKEYVKEAHRILETGGKLYIIEPTKRWSEQDDTGNILPEKEAVKLKQWLQESNFIILKENIAKFSLFVCEKM